MTHNNRPLPPYRQRDEDTYRPGRDVPNHRYARSRADASRLHSRSLYLTSADPATTTFGQSLPAASVRSRSRSPARSPDRGMPPPQTVVTTRRGVGFADPYRNLAGGSKASVALADENGVPPVEYDWPEDRVRTEQGKQLMKVTNDIRLRGLNPEDVEAEAFERYDLGELQNVSTGFHVYTGFVDGEIYRRKYADDPRYVHTEKEKKDRTFVGRLIDCPMETTLDDEEVPLEDPTRVNSVRGSTSRKDRKQVTIEADGLSVCKLWTTSFSGREEPPEGCQRKYRYLLHEDDPVDVNKLNSRMLPAVFYRGEHVVAHGTFINIATPDYSNLKSVPVAYEDAYVTASGATAIVEAMSGRLVNSQLRTYVRTERKKEAARQRTEGDAAFEARKKKKFTFSEATAPNTGPPLTPESSPAPLQPGKEEIDAARRGEKRKAGVDGAPGGHCTE